MGWSIELLENNLKVPKKDRKEVIKAIRKLDLDAHWEYKDEEYTDGEYDKYFINEDGYLYFNSDHQEHMDWLCDERVQAIIKKTKAIGSVKFGSLEGDNRGSFWGYFFDGKGGMKSLVGEVTWRENNEDR
jgi:hypothetical protein